MQVPGYVKLCLIIFGKVLPNPIVELPNGKVLGIYNTTLQGTGYYAFKGIPYAEPPLKNLRFKPPVPPSNWNGTLNGTNFDNICIQTGSSSDHETEDCLYLNVFKPKLEDTLTPLPVMVFVYGGLFIAGYNQKYHPDLFLNKGIIMVTFNYRVGIFGFLTTEDEAIPPNNGLKDQQMVFLWVQKNIHLFGGDPSKITVFGQSAGAVSITYHLLDPKNSGLFQSVILESGTFLCPWALQRKARKRAFSVGAFLNFKFFFTNNSEELLSLLQEKNVSTLQLAANTYQGASEILDLVQTFQGSSWAPVLQTSSHEIIKVPMIIGINSEESLTFFQNKPLIDASVKFFGEFVGEGISFFLKTAVVLKTLALVLDFNMDWLVPLSFNVDNFFQRFLMGLKVKMLYTKGKPFVFNLGGVIRLISDVGIVCPITKFAHEYAQFVDTYFYEFSYDGVLGHLEQQYDGTEHVGHNQELFYTMCSNNSCDGSVYPKSDQVTRERLIELWANFAKYQDPTPEKIELLGNIQWPVVDGSSKNLYYLNINKTLEIKANPKNTTCPIWNYLSDILQY